MVPNYTQTSPRGSLSAPTVVQDGMSLPTPFGPEAPVLTPKGGSGRVSFGVSHFNKAVLSAQFVMWVC